MRPLDTFWVLLPFLIFLSACSHFSLQPHDPRIIDREEEMGLEFKNFYRSEKFTGYQERRDAVELDPRYAEVFASIDEEVSHELKDEKRRLGFIHTFWSTKKRMLKGKYGIDWRSPSELNPSTSYD